MTQGSGELSAKANQILDDFLGRCRQSETQGVTSCNTESVVEDHVSRVTPIEPEYVFEDRRQAQAVSKHLESMFGGEGFGAVDIRVMPIQNEMDAYRIQISASW